MEMEGVCVLTSLSSAMRAREVTTLPKTKPPEGASDGFNTEFLRQITENRYQTETQDRGGPSTTWYELVQPAEETRTRAVVRRKTPRPRVAVANRSRRHLPRMYTPRAQTLM
ncbi:hypothetical protein DENSPDRAFT_148203 [Dentipellis sp. KUC8613]|nr:hypothetical protein DENSPDRAFT_148203 [Dentipellis sp. KUC8613]